MAQKQMPEEVKAMVYPEAKSQAEPGTYKPKPLAKHDLDFVVTYTGVCASDQHQIDNDWGIAQYPLVPGHEVVGHVINVGPEVKDFKVGDVVGLGPTCTSCQECEFCKEGLQNCCPKSGFTYGTAHDELGSHRHYGGFGSYVRTDSRWVFHIPKEIEEQYAGPLMCGGLTVSAPLFEFVNGTDASGKRIGVVGIGGLGHMAVQFAAKMGAEVYAISRTDDKREFAAQLGAKGYIATNNKEDVKKYDNYFHYLLICTSGGSFNIADYTSFLRPYGVMHFVGVPNESLSMHVFSLLVKRLSISASPSGSPGQMVQMLNFAAKHNIRPIIEVFPHSKANEAVQKVRDNTIRFRGVLKNDLI
jgi:alcohol dehydrogenase (NADP+)